MGTTTLDVDSRERAPPSEEGVLDLAQYTLEQVRRDAELVLFRGLRKVREEGSRPSILVRVPVADPPAPATVRRLREEYALRSELDPAYVVRPLAIVQDHGRPMVILEDPLGTPLDLLLNGAMEIAQFLRLAIRVAAALGHVHSRGLMHKDIKPANILVNAAGDQAWLMGLGMASRLPRERQSGQFSEYLVGTLAYMAPEQTGRMNRSIDSRSDLYSLGVTFYEMLTGTLPFTASDPMELVHCHIAKQPTPPCENVSGVPRAVSAIVMKLLAKTAEERYQTAAGVESDLRRCLTEWKTQRRIGEFPLGEHDTPDRLLIPEKLYGRESEIDALLAAFDRIVAGGKPELVLVSGYSGIGKSSVVHELHKSLVPPRGLFASGKFDQYKRNIPYATLAQAFQSLIQRLLGKSEADLAPWRDAFRDALGPNGRLIIELVPELELIIGHQPPAPDLPPQDARRRFQLILRRFIGVFARAEHPLALFLDDLQWLDAATLDLLEDLLTGSDLQHLLLIGAYRTNEVTSAHPLRQKLEAIETAGGQVVEIALAPIFGIFIWDLDGTILDANDAFLRVLGYEHEDLVAGRLRWTDLTAAQWGGRDRQELLEEVQRTGGLQPFEWEHVRKDGSRVPVLVGAAIFEGEKQGVAFVLDLTERKRVDQALRQSEAYLAEAQRLTHTGSWAYNYVTGKITYYSDEAFRLFGLDPRRGRPPEFEEISQLIHPEERDRVLEDLAQALRDKAEYKQDYRIVLPDGTVRDLHSVGHPVLDQAGERVEYFGTVFDVTERRRAEQRLLVQYRVTRILADAATVEEATPKILQAMCECLGWDLGAAWRIDPKAGVLRCAELWRTPSVEAEQFETATRASAFRLGRGLPGRVWATGAPAYIPDIGRDLAFGRTDIATCPVLRAAIAFPILLGCDVLGVIGFISRDLSQPDQDLLVVLANIGSQIGQFTKRAVAVDELQLRVSMLQQLPVAAWSVMPDGTPDIVNQLWFEYTGQTPEYVNSHPEAWMETLHPEDRERASQSYWEGIRSGLGFTMEARFLRARDGTYRWHLNRAVPVRDAEGNVVRFVGTSTDVHDLRQAQEALRNTQTELAHMTRVMTMGELTASIAHEVNQPLGAIVTSAAAGARWLETKPPQMDKARRALERIANDGKRAAEVIRRIRALMKRQAPRKEWSDINEAILEVIALAQYQLRRSEILVETRLGQGLPLVRCDRVQLQQVLLNLIINAIEAMSGIKERHRELTIVSASDRPDTVSVEVRDSGTGLDPEHAPHLFEPFYTTKAEGLGIGLSISRSIVEAHGGRLAAAANAPHGTVFFFSLPVNEPAT